MRGQASIGWSCEKDVVSATVGMTAQRGRGLDYSDLVIRESWEKQFAEVSEPLVAR